MSRIWKSIILLFWIQTALAAAAATLEWTYSCGACRAGGLSLGLPGFAFYLGLSLAALIAGPTRPIFWATFFGFGIHLMLVVQLVASGLICWLCVGAAAVSALLTLLSILHERDNLARLVLALPWSVLLVVGWTGFPTGRPIPLVEESPVSSVRVLVYEQSDCHYCEELRDHVLPEIVREFGPRVRVVRRPADGVPAIRRTPTVIVSPSGGGASGRVFEGVPTVEMLRRAVLDAERKL